MQKSKKIDEILSAGVDMADITSTLLEFESNCINVNDASTKEDVDKCIQYASLLMKSNSTSDKLKSIGIFQTILNQQDKLIFRLQIEELSFVLYQLALAYYSMNRYEDSRKCCEELIGINPDDDRQIKDLLEAVVFKHKEQLALERKQDLHQKQNIGIAVGVFTAIAAAAAFALTRGKRK